MTIKDYILISNVFNSTLNIWKKAKNDWRKEQKNIKLNEPDETQEKIDTINKIVASMKVISEGLCFAFLKDNPNFDKEKFLTDCGFNS